mgnify:CR=1 FL=1
MSREYPCIYFEKDGKCRKFSGDTAISYCVMGPCPEQTLSNADQIRAMSDEELAEFLEHVHVDPCSACCDNLYWCRRNNAPEPFCQKHLFIWLQQPAEEDT